MWCVAFFCNFYCHWVDGHPRKDKRWKEHLKSCFFHLSRGATWLEKKERSTLDPTRHGPLSSLIVSESLWPQFPHGHPILFRSPASFLMGCDRCGWGSNVWEQEVLRLSLTEEWEEEEEDAPACKPPPAVALSCRTFVTDSSRGHRQ